MSHEIVKVSVVDALRQIDVVCVVETILAAQAAWIVTPAIMTKTQ